VRPIQKVHSSDQVGEKLMRRTKTENARHTYILDPDSELPSFRPFPGSRPPQHLLITIFNHMLTDTADMKTPEGTGSNWSARPDVMRFEVM
jgi:hypothetical protein